MVKEVDYNRIVSIWGILILFLFCLVFFYLYNVLKVSVIFVMFWDIGKFCCVM